MKQDSISSSTSNDSFQLSKGMFWFAAIMLTTANFIAVLNMTIANVSVPNIAGSLGATTSQGTWVITSYAVGEAITVPLTGWLASRFGAVRVFVAAMILFGVFSLICAMSDSIGLLVIARIFQGFSGGPLMPLSQTLLLRIFPKEKAGAAVGMWSMRPSRTMVSYVPASGRAISPTIWPKPTPWLVPPTRMPTSITTTTTSKPCRRSSMPCCRWSPISAPAIFPSMASASRCISTATGPAPPKSARRLAAAWPWA